MLRTTGIFALAAAFGLAASTAAWGQNSFSRTRPFDDWSRSPTVSPYLNLTNPQGFANGMPNYQTLVRPQVEARQALRQQRSAINQLQQQAARSAIALREGNQQLRPTGSSARFMYYGNFFPGLSQRR